MPLLWHAVLAARSAANVRRVVVAADHQQTIDAVERLARRHHNGTPVDAVLTSTAHPNGTARIAEAVTRLRLPPDTPIVNVQADEPELPPDDIDAALDALLSPDSHPQGAPHAATLAAPIDNPKDAADPNVVKVVRNLSGRALYFSRSVIPSTREPAAPDQPPAAPLLRHIGVYAYRAAFVLTYARWPQTDLERAERLEQLRILEHGCSIAVALAHAAHPGIDTPEQYDDFVARYNAHRHGPPNP